MYIQKTYIMINSIEHEYSFAGNYGSKGEKRAERKKKTPEQMKKQNQINKINKIRRTIKLNFYPNDLWVTLKYPAGTRKPIESVKKDFKKFCAKMRADYKKRGEEFKYIYRIEIGKRGGIHIHMLLNAICWSSLLIQKNWLYGTADYTHIYEKGGYHQLASYLAKPVPAQEEMHKQYSLFEMNEEDIKMLSTYNTSRNLVRPEPDVKKYVKRTMRKTINDGPIARPGYVIDKDSIRIGINQATGYTYLHYTEVRIKQEMRHIKLQPQPCNDTNKMSKRMKNTNILCKRGVS